jgi:hypothetical protein
MWKVRTKTVSVNGTIGTIKKGLDQNLSLLPVHLLAIEQQRITIMNTAHCIVGVNSFDLLLRSGLTRRTPPDN